MSLSAMTMKLSSCHPCPPVIITSVIRILIILFPFLCFLFLTLSDYYWEKNKQKESILISFLPYIHLLIINFFMDLGKN